MGILLQYEGLDQLPTLYVATDQQKGPPHAYAGATARASSLLLLCLPRSRDPHGCSRTAGKILRSTGKYSGSKDTNVAWHGI